MNFKIKPVFAVVMRHFLLIKSVFNLTSDFYWILLDVITFGFLVQSINKQDTLSLNISTVCVLTNLALCHIFARSATGVASALLENLSDLSFIGLMATPITMIELIFAKMIVGSISAAIRFLMAWICIGLFFGFNVFSVGLIIIPAICSLLLSGWTLGIFMLSIIVTFGKKSESNIYTLPWVFSPFSGVFYSVSILPIYCQKIAAGLPMFYIFDGLTQYIKNGTSLIPALLKSTCLNLIYFTIAVTLFIIMFKRRKNIGLTQLELES
jgi:ABC-2 type transport system permease protein